jgi:pimeloyl-ACP methyl ester carboxylesterase
MLTASLVAIPSVHAEEADFDSGGVHIHYRIEGEGEPVLLIHGFGLNGMMQWTKLRQALKDDYRIIAIDNRGHGKSEKLYDSDQYGIEMVRDQVRLLDHLGIERAHVVGYSMGGGIALQLVAEHPERVQTAVIGGSGWSEPSEEEKARRRPLIDDLENERGFGKLFERLASTESTDEERTGMRQIGALLTAMNDQKALAALLKGRWDDRVGEEGVRGIRTPMAAIIGEHDPIRPAAENLKALNPATTLILVPEATHQTAMGAPEFIDGVRELIAAHPLSDSAE